MEHDAMPLPPVAIVGAGAVGCYYGGQLALAGAPVTLIGRAPLVDAVTRNGLVIERAGRRDCVHVDAATDPRAVASAGVVLISVKSPATADVALAIEPHLRADGVVVSLQNGVDNVQRIADAIEQVVLASVVWVGAYMEGPGIVRHTGRGELELGVTRACAHRHNAAAAVRRVAAMFERAGVKCPIAADIDAALWSKLVINCAINAVSALGRSRYQRMAGDASIRELMECAVREAVAVAQASDVSLDPAAVIEQVRRTMDTLPTQYSSTAQDILRGRATEIDMLNGYVARRGAELGVPTPVNSTLHALVKLREAGDDLV